MLASQELLREAAAAGLVWFSSFPNRRDAIPVLQAEFPAQSEAGIRLLSVQAREKIPSFAIAPRERPPDGLGEYYHRTTLWRATPQERKLYEENE
jgi:hypothetical protein